MKIVHLAIALLLLLATGVQSANAQSQTGSLAQDCLQNGPSSAACRMLWLVAYVMPRFSRELERARIGPLLPPCALRPCPDPPPDFADRFQQGLPAIYAKFGDPSPQPNIISKSAQLEAARAMRTALIRSLKVIDAEIVRLHRLRK
jgi:hypothetical protein